MRTKTAIWFEDTWLDAFIALEDYLDLLPEGKKIVFIDKMP